MAFRSYVNIDWLRIFNDCSNNAESMWNKLKNMLVNETALYIPTVCNFSTWKKKKWVPLDPLIGRLKLKSNLKRSHGKSSSRPRILWTITNKKILGTRSETILDYYIKMNKIILQKILNHILKR